MWIEKYREAIENGECVVGYELMQTLDMLKDHPYWDYDASERVIDFFEHCVRLTKSPFYGKPFVLELWQKAFIEALYGAKTADGHNRFQRALLLISRKNGKSDR